MSGQGESGQIQKKKLSFNPGDIVLEQGSIAKGLYILMSGTLEVYYEGLKVAQIGQKGSFVGEIASLLGGRRIASVKAASPVTMIYVEKVSEYLQQNPSAAMGIAQTLASRIDAMNKKFSHFEKVASSWIDVARGVVETKDITPLKEALREMQEVFVREIKAG